MTISIDDAIANLKSASVPELQELLDNVSRAIRSGTLRGQDLTDAEAYFDAITAEIESRPLPSSLEEACGMTQDEIAKEKLKRKTSWDAAELLATEFPEPKWVVPGLLPAGLAILAGKSKIGKSWLALQLAIAVATGGSFLDTHVERGRVLYLALEDNPKRLRKRLKRMNAHVEPGWLRLECAWLPFGDDAQSGLRDLAIAIEQDKPKLVIIDTVARAFCSSEIDWNSQGEVTAALASLQNLALEHDIAILLIDHHTKATSIQDVILNIIGSVGKGGTADTALGLYREKGKSEATLGVIGRDVDERELALRWDGVISCWKYVGEADGIKQETMEAEVAAALAELGEASVSEIAEFTGMDTGNVHRVLSDLVAQGYVKRLEKQGRRVPYKLL